MDIKSLVQNIIIGKGEKEAKPVENYGWNRVQLILRENYISLIGLNLLFIVCCLPIITIPASFCSLHRVILNFVRSRNQPIISSFFKEFKVNFWQRTICGFFLFIFPFSISFYPRILGWNNLYLVAFIFSWIISYLVSSYFYPLVVLLQVPVIKNIKNAVFLSLIHWKTSLLILCCSGIFYIFLLFMPLYTIPFFVIFLFSFCCLINCSFVNKHFIEHFEHKEGNNS